MARYDQKAWKKTPYATSTVQNPEASIQQLLERYGIRNYEFANGIGPNKRRAIKLRFEIKGKVYRLLLESLDAETTEDKLLLQIKRALFYQLKSLLELASVFFPLDEALFAYRELADGATIREAIGNVQGLSSNGLMPLLLEHKEELKPKAGAQ